MRAGRMNWALVVLLGISRQLPESVFKQATTISSDIYLLTLNGRLPVSSDAI
jgi:hypothetical protein